MCMYVLHVGISHLLVVCQFNADGKHQVATEQSNGQVEVDKVVHGRKQFSVDFSAVMNGIQNKMELLQVRITEVCGNILTKKASCLLFVSRKI